ncbi:TniQ family protein [Streptomyces sp. NPDC023838]|uniref:TniQ family protein n=1 Tax=Streptomyces sp. NPDC023838 TaxID=3154325 RepID=UPI0033F40372
MTQMRVLPLRVKILEDEGLDSWLEALARRNGVSLSAFVSALGLSRGMFTRTLVTGLPPETLRQIETLTGLTAGCLDQAVIPPGFPFGPRLQSRCRFCPRCLAERDGRWLLRWWLPFTFACPRHQTLLHDQCPGCALGIRMLLPGRTRAYPPTTCTRRDKQRDATCGTDLTDTAPLPLTAGHPLLAAQQWVDEVLKHSDPRKTHGVIADLNSCTHWLLRAIEEGDLTGMGDHVIHAWGQRPTDVRTPAERARHLTAAVRGVIAHTATAWLADADDTPAIQAIRVLRERNDTTNKVIPWGMAAHRWHSLSERTRGRFLRAGDPHMGALDRLRARSLTARAASPRPGDHLPTARVRHIPQLLWPGWTVRLMPRHGMEENPFRAIAATLLLVPREAALSARHITDRLNPHLANTMTTTLQLTLKNGHPDVLAALCNLADYLDDHGSPIDYARRRTLVPAVPLTEDAWRQLCFDTDTQPGESANAKTKTPRYVYAQRFVHQLLTGADLTDPRYRLALKTPAERSRYHAFRTALTTGQREALHRHAEQVLDALGIAEPVIWEPPQHLADGLTLPGPRLTDIDLPALQRIVITEQRPPSEAAEELGITLAHARFALDHVLHEPRAWGRSSPLTAWKLRERARTVLTPDYLQREYIDGGRTLTDIAKDIAIPRHIAVEQARALGLTIYRSQRPHPIDKTWLREQYLIRKRSTDSIAQELGTEDETVRRRLKQLGIPRRPAGVHSQQVMILKLDRRLPLDIRNAVEGGLHGWQRLHRFQITMAFPSLETAAAYLNTHQGSLVNQFQRLEHDIGALLFHRSAFGKPQRPTARGKAILRHLDKAHVQALMRTALPNSKTTPMPDPTTLAQALAANSTRQPPGPLRPYPGITVPRIRVRRETLVLLHDLLAHPGEEFYAAQVAARTGLNQGSLSDRLRQLTQTGWLTSRLEDDTAWRNRAPAIRGPGKRRVYYTLTPEGRRAATHEIERRSNPNQPRTTACTPHTAPQPA